jgi:predicted metal-dependent hydrolase
MISRLHVKVVFTNRRDLKVAFNTLDHITVYAPKHMNIPKIYQIISNYSPQIFRKINKLSKSKRIIRTNNFISGDTLKYMGKSYELIVDKDLRISKITNDQIIIKDGTKEFKRKEINNLYKKNAKKYITQVVNEYACILQVKPQKIYFTQAATRFGSCSSRGNISFSCRIIMAPPDVINYVVVHELAHLKHLNHSKEFWKTVSEILPEYKNQKSWLTQFGKTLTY